MRWILWSSSSRFPPPDPDTECSPSLGPTTQRSIEVRPRSRDEGLPARSAANQLDGDPRAAHLLRVGEGLEASKSVSAECPPDAVPGPCFNPERTR